MANQLENLKKCNPGLTFITVDDKPFAAYGKQHRNFDPAELIETALQKFAMNNNTNYVASDKALESHTGILSELQNTVYGGMPTQIGICWGTSTHLNALEYHKGSEVCIACTDAVLLLGRYQDLEFDDQAQAQIKYDSKKVVALYVEKGMAVELYAGVLHFAPIQVDDAGFSVIIVLPKGTNEPLIQKSALDTPENALLLAVNKWLISHPEASEGYNGIYDENIQVRH